MYPTLFLCLHSNAPANRYAAKSLAYQNSLFVYGGRDANDALLHDLHRYDTLTDSWTTLRAVNFDSSIYPSSSTGGNFMLTSWGLLRFGAYYRQPYMSTEYNNYDNSVAVQDPVTLRWRELLVETGEQNLAWSVAIVVCFVTLYSLSLSIC